MKKNNEVTNFMYYMYNMWSESECAHVFKELASHIWGKYLQYNKIDILYWYSQLDSECKQKLVDRANEIYGQ